MELNINLTERNASMKAFFDWKADGFDDVHMSLAESKAAVTKALPKGIRTVLDLGVGTGMELYALTERFPDVRITGIDISPNMLEYIRKRPFADRVECILGDFFETEFGEGYDAVISTSALHHFAPEDKARLYRKVTDCLKPGGWFVNSDRFVDTEEEMLEFYQYYLDHKLDSNHCDTPLCTGLETGLLERAGMTEIRFDPVMTERGYKLLVCRKPGRGE
ncbi:MAG: class I SAM-dependent methyltransferase [Ruminococcaceae bacterium]|nr:class I SAM-dependent methyltransferase [Oscillospiraceae bacterium]